MQPGRSGEPADGPGLHQTLAVEAALSGFGNSLRETYPQLPDGPGSKVAH